MLTHADQLAEAHVTVSGLDFAFAVEPAEPVELDLEIATQPVEGLPDTYLIHFRASRPEGGAFSVRQASVRWEVPAVDMHGFYAPPPSPDEMVKLPYWWIRKQACATKAIPYVGLFHRSGENRAAFGLIDQLTETALDAEMSEATRSYHFHWHKPASESVLSVEQWQETLFISTARQPWPQVLQAYVAAVDQEWPQPRMPVPASAYDPVFCTWTAVHHAVSQEWILRNARLAAELGFGTWLTDDGWFTDQATFGNYAYAGDWEPCAPKFPDFAGHVKAVQALGLRYVLWVAPFMVGNQTKAAQRYRHLLAGPVEGLNFSNLSPQHAETSRVVLNLLQRLMQEYGLDGLKIDFIDAISLDGPPRSDYPTLGEGFYRLMSAMADRLLEIRPDVLIEFRNSYTNLASRRYANLYRASDVPINFLMNRWQVVMLRLLAPDRAVHLDPAVWHPMDSDEAVAVHLVNLICSVPMVSIELDRYPQSHLDLIRHWIGFYRTHRETIIEGEFVPAIELGHIPFIWFNGSHERIVATYEDCPLVLTEGQTPLWILNASTRPFVELLPEGLSGTYTVLTHDKFGRLVAQESVVLPLRRLAVEVGGSLALHREG